jgi:hypothetical protein
MYGVTFEQYIGKATALKWKSEVSMDMIFNEAM